MKEEAKEDRVGIKEGRRKKWRRGGRKGRAGGREGRKLHE